MHSVVCTFLLYVVLSQFRIVPNSWRGLIPRQVMECCGRKRLLMVLTSATSCAAFGLLCISVATDYWLHTMEKIDDKSTTNKTVLYWCSYSGLFRKCIEKHGSLKCTNKPAPTAEYSKPSEHPGSVARCTYIDYFAQDIDRDGLHPTEAILFSIRRSTFFPLSSLLILIVGGIICFIGHCHVEKKVLTFVAGVFFVLAGLCTLVGIILYIGSITGEVGNKPRQQVPDPKFIYYYGSSFMMAVGSFALTELAGVLCVYLFIAKHNHERRKVRQKQRALLSDHNDRQNHVRTRNISRTRSQSNERAGNSRDGSLSRSESYFTYNQMSDTSREMSSYTFPRDPSRHTISTTADTHIPIPTENSMHSVDTMRRTTPV